MARRLIPAVWLAAGATCVAPCGSARAQESAHVSTDVGVGYESQTSPLIRLSPQGELISLDGVQRLGGGRARVGLQAFANWRLDGDWGTSLAADVSQKKAPSAPDFDFGIISIQPSLHRTIGRASVGWGGTLQRMEIAGRPFREVRSTQITWTLPQAEGDLWMAIADIGSNRHASEFSELDASTASLTAQRHLARPLPGLEGVDLTTFIARERNEREHAELSHTSAMVSASFQWSWCDLHWAAGASLQEVRFDATAFADEPQRVDRAVGIDISAEREISKRTTLSVVYSEIRSLSSLGVYDNTFQQVSVKWRTQWR